MKLVLLGGNSVHNKEWIEAVRDKLSSLFEESVIMYYEHWKSEGKKIDIEKEIDKLSGLVHDNSVVFAKSAGIGITLRAILDGRINPLKCIFVGIPLSWEEINGNELSPYFKNYRTPTLFIQAEKDPYASFSEVKKFLNKNKAINCKMIEMSGSSHDYLDIDAIKDAVKEFL